MNLMDVPFVLKEMVFECRDAIIAWRNNIAQLVEKRRLEKMKAVIGEKPPQIELHTNSVAKKKKQRASGRESPLDNL